MQMKSNPQTFSVFINTPPFPFTSEFCPQVSDFLKYIAQIWEAEF